MYLILVVLVIVVLYKLYRILKDDEIEDDTIHPQPKMEREFRPIKRNDHIEEKTKEENA